MQGFEGEPIPDPELMHHLMALHITPQPRVRFLDKPDSETLEAIAQQIQGMRTPFHEVRFVKGVVEARDPIVTPGVEERRQRLLAEFADTVFSGKMTGDPPVRGPHGEAEIILKPGAVPVKQRPFMITGERRAAWTALTDEIEVQGLVEDGHGPWNTPSFPVPKKSLGSTD